MSKACVRHMFPGGNTSAGFFSYYDYIIDPLEARRIFVIKGGPGVGKSTFMKNAAKELIDRGYDAEMMHCSSDDNSLDGVVFPQIGVALIDGTAPHVVDPKNPGAVDEIIHLGDFWDEGGMRANRERILEANKETGRLFARAYRYIRAAADVYEDTVAINGLAADAAAVNTAAAGILEELFDGMGASDRTGRQRHLFASAITPEGLKNYLETLLNTERIYVLRGSPGTGADRVLERVRSAALDRGFDVESYYCALMPRKLEHIVIHGLDASLTTANLWHSACVDAYREINMDEYLDGSIIGKYRSALQYDGMQFETLLGRAVSTIADAKAVHDHLETYYIPNMDFEAVRRCWEDTMARILDYAGELQ